MGKAELKNKLIEIINTSEEEFLHMVNALQKAYYEDSTIDFYDQLPKEVKEIINESIEHKLNVEKYVLTKKSWQIFEKNMASQDNPIHVIWTHC